MALTQKQLIGAIVLSLVLAFPLVTLIAAMVVFPILAALALAAFVNFSPLLLLVAMLLRRFGLAIDSRALMTSWQFAAIVWIGCAYGLSHWGDVGRSLGARNLPYFEVLFAPVLYLFGHRVM